MSSVEGEREIRREDKWVRKNERGIMLEDDGGKKGLTEGGSEGRPDQRKGGGYKSQEMNKNGLAHQDL